MAIERGANVSEAQIAVHWKEEEYLHRSPNSSGRRIWSILPSGTGSRRNIFLSVFGNTRNC